MPTLFISDLHLDPAHTEEKALFLRFLQNQARQADALYILGDLFEVWIGDDQHSPFVQEIIAALRAFTQTHVPVYIMPGNRDFLMGVKFMQQTGCQLLSDPSVIDLYGIPTLLMHGDTLCISDKAYMRFRRIAQNPRYQRLFLKLPLIIRRSIAHFLRKASKRYTSTHTETLMDADIHEINRVMQKAHVSCLIHGHTHRPSIQLFNNQRRIVLSDWHKQGNMLVYQSDGRCRLVTI